MAYKTRPGIVLVKICDTHLLVATRSEWEHCPVVRPIPKIIAACWRLMEKGQTDVDVIRTFANLLKKTEEEVKNSFSKSFSMLVSEGFLIDCEDDKT